MAPADEKPSFTTLKQSSHVYLERLARYFVRPIGCRIDWICCKVHQSASSTWASRFCVHLSVSTFGCHVLVVIVVPSSFKCQKDRNCCSTSFTPVRIHLFASRRTKYHEQGNTHTHTPKGFILFLGRSISVLSFVLLGRISTTSIQIAFGHFYS